MKSLASAIHHCGDLWFCVFGYSSGIIISLYGKWYDQMTGCLTGCIISFEMTFEVSHSWMPLFGFALILIITSILLCPKDIAFHYITDRTRPKMCLTASSKQKPSTDRDNGDIFSTDWARKLCMIRKSISFTLSVPCVGCLLSYYF